jgi:hypothetical protein
MLTALAEPIDRRRARLPAIVLAIRAVAPPLGIHVRDHLGRCERQQIRKNRRDYGC